jgi:DNA polymerase-3 subunit beta
MVTIDKFRAIKINISSNFIEITASGEDKGIGKEKLFYSEEEDKFCQFTGRELSIGLNPKYLTDVLGVIKDTKVELYFNDGYSPLLVKTQSHPDDSFVIMPVKV